MSRVQPQNGDAIDRRADIVVGASFAVMSLLLFCAGLWAATWFTVFGMVLFGGAVSGALRAAYTAVMRFCRGLVA